MVDLNHGMQAMSMSMSMSGKWHRFLVPVGAGLVLLFFLEKPVPGDRDPGYDPVAHPKTEQTRSRFAVMAGRNAHYVTQDLFFSHQNQLDLENPLNEKLSSVSRRNLIAVPSGVTFDAGTVRAGSQVTDNLFVSYHRELEKQGANSVEVEYRLGPCAMLRGTGSDRGQTALDLLWRIDY